MKLMFEMMRPLRLHFFRPVRNRKREQDPETGEIRYVYDELDVGTDYSDETPPWLS